MNLPRTQKARGVYALCTHGYTIPEFTLVQRVEDLLKVKEWPRFARPCPVTPCHGFVDSRIVSDPDSAAKVLLEAWAADPNAEMLLMRPIKAKANAVLTPGSVTFGPGHDGATQGKACVTFNLAGCAVEKSSVARAAGITEWPFVEAVVSEAEHLYLTQIRNGPKVTGTCADRVPASVTVGSVLELDPATLPDALEWEARCKDLPLDTVIYYPGGSQTSHYAVHAALRGLAVFTTRKPSIGETLAANVADVAPYDVASFRRGIEQGFSTACVDWQARGAYDRGVRLGLFAVHHAMTLRTGPSAWLLGYGIALLVRYGMTASCGEARYAQRGCRGSRSEIYAAMLSDPLLALKRGTRLFRLFIEHDWHNGSVGGPAWARCTKATIDLDYALRRAYHEGSEIRFKDLIAAAHNMVNQAHNGGWYLNKFCGKKHFDRHAAADLTEILETAAWAYQDYVDGYAWPANNNARKWTEKRKARLMREGKRAFVIVMALTPNGVNVQVRSQRTRFSIDVDLSATDAEQVKYWIVKCVPAQALDGRSGEYYMIQRSALPWRVAKALMERGI